MEDFEYKFSDMLRYIEPFYDSPLRFYHNRDHISRMVSNVLVMFENGSLTEEEMEKLTTAILFHDVIQNPFKGELSNESLSALVYQNYCSRQGYDFDWDVVELIKVTEHHFDDNFTSHKKLTDIIMDLDLLSFADDYEEFCQTNHDIDQEFLPFIPQEKLNEGRKSFLKNITENNLLKFRVLDTDGFMTRQAYNNINRYISENYENE